VQRAGGTVEAMRKLVTLESDRRSQRRFSELVKSAVEQLNEGSWAGRRPSTSPSRSRGEADRRRAAQTIRERRRGSTRAACALPRTSRRSWRWPGSSASSRRSGRRAVRGAPGRESAKQRLLLALPQAHGMAAAPSVKR
jgi:hypothetical protein